MHRDRIAGIGFQRPDRNARPLTKRKTAIAHLVMTAALVIGIVIAATAVTLGMARAETLNAMVSGQDGQLPLMMLIGAVLAGIGGIAAAVTRLS